MVVLNKIYTRTGDDGTTALGTGERRKKYDLRVAAYGTLDEVNAAIGIARLHTGDDAALDAALAHVQNDLFDAGADLTTPGKGRGPGGRGGGRARGGGGGGGVVRARRLKWGSEGWLGWRRGVLA